MAHRSERGFGNSLGGTISDHAISRATTDGVILALVFAQGTRPDSESIANYSRLDTDGARFSVSHHPNPNAGWLELLTSGLTFDLRGLRPAAPVDLPGPGTLLGLDTMPRGEAVALLPGPHLAEGRAMLPVVRALAGLGAALSAVAGVEAVCWLPSGAWMAPGYFRRIVGDWLAGGAFPALGLTTLQNDAGGNLISRGLSLFSGQELLIQPPADMPLSVVARIAVRLLHELAGQPAVLEPVERLGPEGEDVHLTPDPGGKTLRVLIDAQR